LKFVKILLISPNGLQELSGGGLYLRSLAQALCAVQGVSRLTVISKEMGRGEAFDFPANCERIYLKKDKTRDVAARVRLYPTYLITHRETLVRHARLADVVLFHNSRCGGLMADMRRQMPDKTFGILSDNVEAELKRQHRDGNVLRQVSNALDTWLIRRAEAPCRTADFMTFITDADRKSFDKQYGIPTHTGILPISLNLGKPDAQAANVSKTVPKILFTAHFGFEPNQTALRDFADVARLFGEQSEVQTEFIIAGARAAEMAAPYPQLSVIDSPSPTQMSAVFASATVYLAPVSWGSGMKTKVAEALSFGLPVICMPNAAVGYETALADTQYQQAICVVDSAQQMADALHRILQSGDLSPLRNAATAAFNALYSQASQTKRFEVLLLAQ